MAHNLTATHSYFTLAQTHSVAEAPDFSPHPMTTPQPASNSSEARNPNQLNCQSNNTKHPQQLIMGASGSKAAREGVRRFPTRAPGSTPPQSTSSAARTAARTARERAAARASDTRDDGKADPSNSIQSIPIPQQLTCSLPQPSMPVPSTQQAAKPSTRPSQTGSDKWASRSRTRLFRCRPQRGCFPMPCPRRPRPWGSRNSHRRRATLR